MTRTKASGVAGSVYFHHYAHAASARVFNYVLDILSAEG
jgi:hypothetical protein